MIFLDEPTRNIDSLNEGIILRSLDREKENKTILLVSHRKSTMAIADDVVAMEEGEYHFTDHSGMILFCYCSQAGIF